MAIVYVLFIPSQPPFGRACTIVSTHHGHFIYSVNCQTYRIDTRGPALLYLLAPWTLHPSERSTLNGLPRPKANESNTDNVFNTSDTRTFLCKFESRIHAPRISGDC